MPFTEFLSIYYGIQVDGKIELDHKEGYRDGNYYYFITSVDNREIVYMEQTSLAYFLRDNHYYHISLPIPNSQGEWVTPYHDKNYMVLQVTNMQEMDNKSDALKMAEFHAIGSGYQYQPREISSYGDWKNLWIEKLDYVEEKVMEEAKKDPNPYYQYLMDVFPYVIGISENAIQYIRESETESRFHQADQGTITFHRYMNQLQEPILWMENLIYDHPTRDIAEYIRRAFLFRESEEKIVGFLNEYQSVQPLSIFALRSIYGRLLFPTHILDVIYRGFSEEEKDPVFQEVVRLMEAQEKYQQYLKNFYRNLGLNTRALSMPEVPWL